MNSAPRRLLLGLLGVVVLGVAWWVSHRGSAGRAASGKMTPAEAEKAAQAYLALEAREQAARDSIWAAEIVAERREDEFLRLWDALNAAPDPWIVIASDPVAEVRLPTVGPAEKLSDGTLVSPIRGSDPSQPVLTAAQWSAWLQTWAKQGWKWGHTTWALTDHRAASSGSSEQARLTVTAQFDNPTTSTRAVLRLQLAVSWSEGKDGSGTRTRFEVRDGQCSVRQGPLLFRPWLEERIPADRSVFTDPLLLWDLDGDGLSEVILVGADRVWRNQPDAAQRRRFVSEPWLGLPAQRVVAAVRVDVNQDGHDDLVLAQTDGVTWWSNPAGARQSAATPVQAWQAPVPLKHPQVITAGDVNGDGFVDLWVAQYKLPYQGGQFPTPWDDANDGFPSYLLINDGTGHFTDATESSGLGGKRFRRTYSASWIDLDLDGRLDLVNVSDFAGLDLFLNRGNGRFDDVTSRLGESRHAFGMSHVVGDVNHDGRPDLLMLGMNSGVADRLRSLGLERTALTGGRRDEMTRGNRLFLGQPGSLPLTLASGGLGEGCARTGWSWGAAWADFNQDGYLDLAVANGHETRASVRDYERQFWLHDRFVGSSRNDPVSELYFRTAAGRRQADQASYGGWQSNVLLLNQANQTWEDVAWLWGLAEVADCRNLLADDLDGDGRLDLIVTTQEEWPQKRQRLLVFHNEMPVGNGVGFRLAGPYPSGAKVELETSAGRQTAWCVTGDGYRSQGPPSVHFGLGNAVPRSATVTWPGQTPQVVELRTNVAWQVVTPKRP